MPAVNTDEGTILEVLNNKSDRDLRNVDTTVKADAVVDYQIPTVENNYTWYRKYASGWVEQGGIIATPNADTTYSVSMPKEILDTNYLPQLTTTTSNNNAVIASIYTGNAITTTGFSFRLSHKYNSAGTPTKTVWQVSGMTAA